MWLEGLYWIDHVWSSIKCERLDALSICFVCDLYVGSNLLI